MPTGGLQLTIIEFILFRTPRDGHLQYIWDIVGGVRLCIRHRHMDQTDFRQLMAATSFDAIPIDDFDPIEIITMPSSFGMSGSAI